MAARDRAHRDAQARLADLVETRLGAILDALEAPMEQSGFDAYSRAATLTVAGGQRQAAQLAIAYVARGAPLVRPPSAVRAIEPVRVTAESPVTRSPMLRLWGQVAEGVAFADALASSRGFAAELASRDMLVAQRAGLDEGASASGRQIVGWRKELSGSACDWCQMVAEGSYGSADAVPFHEHDLCSVSPIYEGE